MIILEEKYSIAPINMMFSSLEELFSGNIEGTDAGGILDWVNSKMILWSEFEFFDYFVPDVLFTFVLMFRLPDSEVRQRCMREVFEKMRDSRGEFLPSELAKRGEICVET